MKTYRDIVLERTKSLGISIYSAYEIVNAIIEQCEYAPQVFEVFAEDLDDNRDKFG